MRSTLTVKCPGYILQVNKVTHVTTQASKSSPRPSWCPPALKFLPSTRADKVSLTPVIRSQWQSNLSSQNSKKIYAERLEKFLVS